jgi:hypothetical protein
MPLRFYSFHLRFCSDVADFIPRWRDTYAAAFPEAAKTATFFSMLPGPGAFELTSAASSL